MKKKQLEGAIVFMNMFTDPDISIDDINKRYGTKLSDQTSKEDALEVFVKLNKITFGPKEVPAIKTLEEFESQENLDLTEFLGEKPIEIDEEMYHHILCGYVPCNCDIKIKEHEYVGQGGEAYDSFKDNPWNREAYTYLTVKSYPDNTFWHLGILPNLNGEG